MTTLGLIQKGIDYSSIALSDGNEDISFGQLEEYATKLREEAHSGIVVLAAENTLKSVSAYIACVQAHLPVLLLDKDVDSSYLQDVATRFSPEVIVGFQHSVQGFVRTPDSVLGDVQVSTGHIADVNEELCVMLATSGSTGSPKFVKLSRGNILSNASSIAESLGINSSERAITSLPFSYTYGLSVINSHIVTGASLFITASPVVSAEFWNLVSDGAVTSIAGVPTTYRMLRQMRWDPKAYPSLKYMTQAGGRLPDVDRTYFLDLLEGQDIRFYVMYGQTEATARISVAPPELLHKHISTAGYPIPGGSFSVINPDETGVGEILFSGPNVMMGYAEHELDLVKPQELPQQLLTGDLGYLSEGALFLVGRTKRIVKVFGVRVSLDDVDRWLSKHGHGIAVQGNDIVVVFIEGPFEDTKGLRTELSEYLHVNKVGIRIEVIEKIPLLSSGKIDFQTLTVMANV